MREIRYLDKLIDELAKGKGHGEDSAKVTILRCVSRAEPPVEAGAISG